MGPPPTDGHIANRYNQEYAHQVWGLVAPFLLLVGLTYHGSRALGRLFPRKQGPADVEADRRGVRHHASIRHIPLVITNAYRVLAFRTTFIVGPFSLNLAEVALTVAYIVSLFVWSFINSVYFCFPLIHELTILHSYLSQWNEVRAAILSEPRGKYRLRSAPARCRPWH